MNFSRFLFNFLILLALIFALNTRYGQIPPLGKFFDPFSGFWQNAVPETTSFQQNVHSSYIKSGISVYYDKYLIPHIYAQNDDDASFALGYATASNRLWQMEIQTHAAAGRISEIIGTKGLEHDIRQRRIGMAMGAEETYKLWKKYPDVLGQINAYSAGINHYISNLEYKDLPVEYKLLDYWPEEWTAFKTALILKHMASILTLHESDIENTFLLKYLGLDQFNRLFPDYPEGIEPVVPENTSYDFAPHGFKHFDTTVYINDSLLPMVPYPKPSPLKGSNNWAISGQKTKSGYPILANDMHLDLSLPMLWFQAQITTPNCNVFGHTIPGSPYIITGFNDSIAWGFTNAYRDMVDWYKIHFRDHDMDEYLYDSTWLKIRRSFEEIKVRDGETFYDTVMLTHLGPIVYDSKFADSLGKNFLAMKWIGHEPTLEPLTFSKIAKAKNYADFKEAISYFSCPPQNIAFASSQGDIAIHVQGKFPIKDKYQGKFVMDGATSMTDWHGYIPNEQNPYILNPESGFVSSANQHAVSRNYPYHVYSARNEYYRNRRINQILKSKSQFDVEDVKKMQYDVQSIKAEEILPLLLDTIVASDFDETKTGILDTMKNWNYEYNNESVAPVYFETWWKEFYSLLWDELDTISAPIVKPTAYNTYLLIKNGGLDDFVDIIGTEAKDTLPSLANASFDSMVTIVDKWRVGHNEKLTWGHYQDTEIPHLAKIKPFGAYHLNVGGSAQTILANTKSHGPSQHLIVELGPKVKAWGNYPGGQSGNPGSIYYNTFLEYWKAGEYIEIPFYNRTPKNGQDILFQQIIEPIKNKE